MATDVSIIFMALYYGLAGRGEMGERFTYSKILMKSISQLILYSTEKFIILSVSLREN